MLRAPNNCVPNGSNNAPAILLNTADMSLLKILQFDCYKHNEPLIPILTNLCVLQYYNLQYISYPTPSTKLYNKNGFSLLYYQLQYLSGSPYIHECYYYQRTVASINITWTLLLLHFSTRCIDLFPSHAQFLLQDRTLVRVQ